VCACEFLRFVTDQECVLEQLPWGPHEWLCRPGLTDARQLQVVRVTMPAGKCRVPPPSSSRRCSTSSTGLQQFVGRQKRVITAGTLVHVPTNEVHGSYNVFAEPATFLAILSPATCKGPPLVDVSQDEPWRTLAPLPAPR
jgi:hypothetical protein